MKEETDDEDTDELKEETVSASASVHPDPVQVALPTASSKRHAGGGKKKKRKKDLANVATTAKKKSKTSPERDLPCLLYTSPSPRDAHESRMPSSA